ncbi:MAG: cytochrome bc complex cytochrome b subunit [Ignavibacteria bacterium]|nr:MAG: cytochrome bc complex cytochrome b subunit [Ignavibacteria bacterium]
MNRFSLWLDERLHLSTLIQFLSRKSVPRHKHSFWYIFGGLALFFFLVQLITGVLLLLYYSPTPETANESVRFIESQVPYGWFVRSLHAWSANLMVATVLVHLFSTYFMRAYRRPRELMWVSGLTLLLVVLGFGFTGYLLPWDTTAYFATQIGTEIPRTIPVIGELVVQILRGGDYIAGESLKRLFALHVAILPLVSLGLIGLHLTLNQVHGTSIPIGVTPARPGIPFFPNYVYRDMIAWTLGLMLLLYLSILFPVKLGDKVDPLASAPLGIKPEWYFLTLYETLRLVPGMILGISSEAVVNVGVVAVILTAFLIPFLDQAAGLGRSNRLFTVLGLIAIAYMIVAVSLAYLT